MIGCQKRYTDPSSLRKHVKNHSKEDQDQCRTGPKDRPSQDLATWQDQETTTTTNNNNNNNNNSSSSLGILSAGGMLSPGEYYSDIYRSAEEFPHYRRGELHLKFVEIFTVLPCCTEFVTHRVSVKRARFEPVTDVSQQSVVQTI